MNATPQTPGVSPRDLRECLEAAGPVEYVVMGAPRRSAAAEACSEEGLFVVFPDIAEPSLLRPPIDWTQNPFASQSWCAQLHTLRFLGVLISRYRTNGDLQALVSACEMALDWVAANPRGAPDLSEMAWSDKVAGDRAPFLGYLLRSAAVEGLLTDEGLTTLFGAVLNHAEFLYDDANYTAVSNHGLYQDVGLVLLSSYVDFLPQAVEWRRRGVERFRETLTKHVASGGEGVHLEHSPAYQWLMVGLVRRFRELADLDDERLLAMLGELEEAAGWLVLPDGSTPPLGDSDMLPAPLWAQDAAHRCQRAGFDHRRRRNLVPKRPTLRGLNGCVLASRGERSGRWGLYGGMSESDAKAAAAGVPEAREDAEMFAVQQLRPMEQPKWNEGRLDDLNKRVDDGIGRLDEERKEFRGEVRAGFAKVEEEFKAVRGEMKAGFDKVDERFESVGEEFTAVRGDVKSGFDRMNRTLIMVAGGIITALIAAPHL